MMLTPEREIITIKKKIIARRQSSHSFLQGGNLVSRATFCQLMFQGNVLSSEILCKPHGKCPSRKQIIVCALAFKVPRDGVCLKNRLHCNQPCPRMRHCFSVVQPLAQT